MKRYCLTLDLKDDPELIKEYEIHHQKIWPEIIESIKHSGIHQMEIYRFQQRLFMIMGTADDFSFEQKAKDDIQNKKVQEWEKLMLKYQQPLDPEDPFKKWMLMNKIFDLTDSK
jgi:L-rhamnose mutarotase